MLYIPRSTDLLSNAGQVYLFHRIVFRFMVGPLAFDSGVRMQSIVILPSGFQFWVGLSLSLLTWSPDLRGPVYPIWCFTCFGSWRCWIQPRCLVCQSTMLSHRFGSLCRLAFLHVAVFRIDLKALSSVREDKGAWKLCRATKPTTKRVNNEGIEYTYSRPPTKWPMRGIKRVRGVAAVLG